MNFKIFRYFKIYPPLVIIRYLLLEAIMMGKRTILRSYSQWGEDVVIDKILKRKQKGYYVDVGAYDPSRFSNTKRFYLRGWRGMNIEPDPLRIKKFYKNRPRDINVNLGIANKNGVLRFFTFEPQTLSTFSKKAAQKYKEQGYKLIRTKTVRVCKLSEVLEKNSPSQRIDFISIDTEGLDYEILKSNNWEKFRPTVICIEQHNKDIRKFLQRVGYKKTFENKTNAIFQLQTSKKIELRG